MKFDGLTCPCGGELKMRIWYIGEKPNGRDYEVHLDCAECKKSYTIGRTKNFDDIVAADDAVI